MATFAWTAADGQRITFKRPYVLNKYEGLGGPDVDVQTQRAPFQDGATYLDSLMEPRAITLEGTIVAQSRDELLEYRRQLAKAFNPKLGPGALRWDQGARSYEIRAVPNGGPRFPHLSVPNAGHFLIPLLAPDPHWYDPAEKSATAAILETFIFPWVIEWDGITMGEIAQEQVALNAGDVPCPVEIEFRGPSVNPVVTNLTTGEFVAVWRTLMAGDILRVDSSFERPLVVVERSDGSMENALHWLTPDSTLWQLIPGENVIQYSADAGQEEATVTIRWRNRFVGV